MTQEVEGQQKNLRSWARGTVGVTGSNERGEICGVFSLFRGGVLSGKIGEF